MLDMPSRMLGAALLKSDTYEDVERDSSAIVQALLVVLIVAITTGVGGVLSGDVGWIQGVVFGAMRGVILWVVWALVALLVGTTILKTSSTEADWGQVARGTGFAQTPGLFNVLISYHGWVGPSKSWYSCGNWRPWWSPFGEAWTIPPRGVRFGLSSSERSPRLSYTVYSLWYWVSATSRRLADGWRNQSNYRVQQRPLQPFQATFLPAYWIR